MTLPDERYRSIMQTRQFLLDLLDTRKTPRVPRTVRNAASRCLRHFPGELDLDQIEQCAPHVIQQRMEPLYKMVLAHEMAERVREDYAAEGMITVNRSYHSLDTEGGSID